MSEEVDQGRRKFLTQATIATGAVGAAFAAVPFVASRTPSARAKALGAPVEVDLSLLEPGMMTTVQWRRQPVWVVRRTRDMLERLPTNDPQLKDPESESSEQPDYARNEFRSRNPEYLVLVSTCTHLGCLPKQRFQVGVGEGGPGWPGGFFCVCHGSKFDLAGRVYKNVPAPTNLVVPPHAYLSDTRIIIGADQKGAA